MKDFKDEYWPMLDDMLEGSGDDMPSWVYALSLVAVAVAIGLAFVW